MAGGTVVFINGRKGILFSTPEEAEMAEERKEYPYLYYLRHGDRDWGRPLTVEPFCVVNRFGVVLVQKPFRFRKGKDYVQIRSFG